jgi:hypothetical protein
MVYSSDNSDPDAGNAPRYHGEDTSQRNTENTGHLPYPMNIHSYIPTPTSHPFGTVPNTPDLTRFHARSNSGGNTFNRDRFAAMSPFPVHHHMNLPPPRVLSYINPIGFQMGNRGSHNRHSTGVLVQDAIQKQLSALVTGVSQNYLGDPYLRANQSANIPDDQNTSVWITNLPPDLDHKMLLDSIRDCGKVWAAVVNGPEKGHTTAAAKVVFFDVSGAQNLLQQAREGKFIVGGYIPRVRRNRIKTQAKPLCPNSRVLHIEGPSCIVNQPYLASLFHGDDIKWQDEVVLTLSYTEMLTRLEWRFGSYRCQAESARHLIDKVKKRPDLMSWDDFVLWQGVTVHFGVDPCVLKPGKR